MTNAPNVFWYYEPYPADPRAVGINVNNVSPGACSRRHHVNLDLHPHAQWDRRRNQRAMQGNNYRLAVARQRFGDTFGPDHDLSWTRVLLRTARARFVVDIRHLPVFRNILSAD